MNYMCSVAKLKHALKLAGTVWSGWFFILPTPVWFPGTTCVTMEFNHYHWNQNMTGQLM